MEMQLFPAAAIATEPLDVGPTSKLSLVDVVARPQGAAFTAGVCEVFPGDAVDFDYDGDAAVCYMLEGEITLREGDETQAVQARRRRLHPAERRARRLLEHRVVRQVLLRDLPTLALIAGRAACLRARRPTPRRGGASTAPPRRFRLPEGTLGPNAASRGAEAGQRAVRRGPASRCIDRG